MSIYYAIRSKYYILIGCYLFVLIRSHTHSKCFELSYLLVKTLL